MIKRLLILIIITANLLKNQNCSISSISKCHYEGDFQVTCSESNELMRTANIINGLHYNETQCLFNPIESYCHRQTLLSYCIDKPKCSIKNAWTSLQPECEGNSYYTQFNYDCQPAYHMCEDTIVKDAFSGLIYSPFYPYSFRTENNNKPCFLTINLPKDHHVEITLDHFDIFKYQNCLADFLEIQEYKQDLSDIYYSNNLQQNKKILKTNQKPVYKWSTIATMCGKEQTKHIIRASSDVVNFKFRSISSNHHYLQQINNNNISRIHTGFRLYFQAIPPIVENINYNTNKIQTSSTINNKLNEKSSNQQEILDKQEQEGQQLQPKENNKPELLNTNEKSMFSWFLFVVLLIIVIITVIVVLIIALVIISLKR
jgi:hypothetical protein